MGGCFSYAYNTMFRGGFQALFLRKKFLPERSEQSICHCVLAILVIYLFAYGLINFMDRLPFYEILTYDSELFLRSVVTADHILQYPLLLVIGYYLKVFYMDRKKSDIIFKGDDHIKIHF